MKFLLNQTDPHPEIPFWSPDPDGGDPNPNPDPDTKPDDAPPSDGGDPQDGKVPETVTLRVDKENVDVTPEELQALAQKGFAADKRFQEAAELKKEASVGMKIQKLFPTIVSGQAKADEVTEFANLLGVEVSQLESLLSSPSDPGSKDKTPPPKDKAPAPVDWDNLSPELKQQLQGMLEYYTQETNQRTRTQVQEETAQRVDKDAVLGKIMSDEGIPDAVKDDIRAMAFEEVQRRILSQEEYGPQLYDQAINRIRSRIKTLGIPASLKQQPITVGLGPGGTVPATVSADEPIERVASTEDGYEDNALKRLMQLTLKRSRTP